MEFWDDVQNLPQEAAFLQFTAMLANTILNFPGINEALINAVIKCCESHLLFWKTAL